MEIRKTLPSLANYGNFVSDVFGHGARTGIGNNEMCISLNVIHLRTINECDAKN